MATLAMSSTWPMRPSGVCATSPFLEVRADETRGVCAFGLNHAGIDGVDADLPSAKLLGEDTGDGVDRALSRRYRPCCSAASGC